MLNRLMISPESINTSLLSRLITVRAFVDVIGCLRAPLVAALCTDDHHCRLDWPSPFRFVATNSATSKAVAAIDIGHANEAMSLNNGLYRNGRAVFVNRLSGLIVHVFSFRPVNPSVRRSYFERNRIASSNVSENIRPHSHVLRLLSQFRSCFRSMIRLSLDKILPQILRCFSDCSVENSTSF